MCFTSFITHDSLFINRLKRNVFYKFHNTWQSIHKYFNFVCFFIIGNVVPPNTSAQTTSNSVVLMFAIIISIFTVHILWSTRCFWMARKLWSDKIIWIESNYGIIILTVKIIYRCYGIHGDTVSHKDLTSSLDKTSLRKFILALFSDRGTHIKKPRPKCWHVCGESKNLPKMADFCQGGKGGRASNRGVNAPLMPPLEMRRNLVVSLNSKLYPTSRMGVRSLHILC